MKNHFTYCFEIFTICLASVCDKIEKKFWFCTTCASYTPSCVPTLRGLAPRNTKIFTPKYFGLVLDQLQLAWGSNLKYFSKSSVLKFLE